MDFEPNNIPPCYKNQEETIVIKQDDEVFWTFLIKKILFLKIRLKIIGIRVDATDIFAIGTLMDDYLGLSSAD